MKRILISLFLTTAFLSVRSIDLTQIDLSHQYDPDAPVQLKYRVTQSGDTIRVFMEYRTDSLLVWNREFLLQRGYASENHRLISPRIQTIKESRGFWKGSFSFLAPSDADLLIVRIFADFEFFFDMPLEKGTMNFPGFYPVTKGEVILTPYLKSWNLAWNRSGTPTASSYTDNFDPADPPFDEMKALAPVVREDTLIQNFDSTLLENYHFYFFHFGENPDNGVTLLKVPPYYPEYRVIGELIGPMKYITTDAEFRTLGQTSRQKRTFDEFWINTYGTKFRARNAIRKYFRSVELANEYFTDFKQGWKTDRGMIFIVYGTPYELYRSDRGETWLYEGEEFEFLRITTLFGPIYVLQKDRSFEKDWYRQVGRLRKGE